MTPKNTPGTPIPPPVEPDIHRILAETSIDWLLWVDPRGHPVYSSPACEKLTGYSSAELVENPHLLMEMVVDEDRERFRDHMRNVLTNKDAADELRLRIRTKQGKIRWIQHSCNGIYDTGGSCLGRRVTHRDIDQTVFQENLSAVLYGISELAAGDTDLAHIFPEIRSMLETLIPVPNLFIGLYDRDSDIVSFPYYADDYDGVTPRTRKATNGLTEYVLRTGEPLLADSDELKRLTESGEVRIVGSQPIDWLGLPLKNGSETFGVMALQSYDPTIRYSLRDLDVLTFVSRQISRIILAKQAEHRLRTAEEKFSKAFQSSPEAMVISYLETGEIIEVNRTFETLSGLTRDQVFGHSSFEFKLWRSTEDREIMVRALKEKGQARNIEFAFEDPRGRVSYGILSSDLIEIDGEQCALTMIRDVTRQKEAETKLRMKEDMLSRMLDMLPVGVWLTDEKGRIIRANPAAHRIWAGAYFIGPDQYNTYKGWTLPDHKPIIAQDWAGYRAINRGETTLDEEIEIEGFDGTHRIIRNSALPLRDERGKILGSIVVNQDISDFKRVQSELQANNDFLQTLLDAIPNPLFHKNAQGVYIGCNRTFETQTGMTRSTIVGHTDFDLFNREQAEYFTAMDRHLLDKPGVMEYETQIDLGNGVFRDAIISKATYSGSDGEIAGLIGVFIDITERKMSERAWQKSEENLRALLHSTLQGFILLDVDFRVITFNPMANRWVKYIGKRDLIEGELVEPLIPDSVMEPLTPLLKAALHDTPQLFTRKITIPDGRQFWFDFNVLPVHNAMGDITGVCMSITDNTELKNALQRVQHLSSALEQSSVMVFILDLNGKIDFVNHVVVARTGYTEKDLVGHSMNRFYFDEPGWMRGMLESVRTSGKDLHTETLAQPKHGEPFWISLSISPILDQTGVLTHFLVEEEDISERRLREDVLHQSESKYRELFDTAPYGIIVLDVVFAMLDLNRTAAGIIGYEKSECFGRHLTEWVVEKDLDLYNEMLDRMTNEGIAQSEIALNRKDGGLCWIEMTATQLLDETGSTSGALIHCLDISARRQIEVQLRHAQKMESIGQLAAGIAHEINTPTQFVSDNLRFLSESFGDLHKLIMGYHEAIEYVRENFESSEVIIAISDYEEQIDLDFILSDIPQAFTEANDGLQRISKIVKAMKEFSHPETDNKTPTDINHAIESTVTVARNEWKYVADLELKLGPNLPMTPCLPGEFNQVILNLVINAAHAIEEARERIGDREKGQIVISTRHRTTWP
jgi:PAS domain S-box-containing protein